MNAQEALTEERIQERIATLFSVDEAVCGGCGVVAGPVADDPEWFIDTEMVAHDPEPYIIAVIRCPRCW